MTHIGPDKDYSEVIKLALESEGWTQGESVIYCYCFRLVTAVLILNWRKGDSWVVRVVAGKGRVFGRGFGWGSGLGVWCGVRMLQPTAMCAEAYVLNLCSAHTTLDYTTLTDATRRQRWALCCWAVC